MKKHVKILTFFIALASGAIFADTTTTTTVAAPPTVTVTPAPVVVQPPAPTTTVNTTVITNSGPSEADGRIVSTIYARYGKDAALIGTGITAVSQGGIVTLTGNVTAQSQADEAVLVAKRVIGVKGVISNITVSTNPNGSINPPVRNY